VTNVLTRAPVDLITEQARRVRVGRVLLTLLAGVFYLAGWAAGKAAMAVVWCAVAVKVGWQEARKAPARGPAG
jgi:hypothetical protein